MTWSARFPDGSRLSAPTATDLLDAWRMKSWQPWDAGTWPDVLVKRAYVWSGRMIDPTLPAAKLLAELDEAGLIRLEVNDNRKGK